MNPAVCRLGPAAAVVAVSVCCRRQLCPQLAVTAGDSGASSACPQRLTPAIHHLLAAQGWLAPGAVPALPAGGWWLPGMCVPDSEWAGGARSSLLAGERLSSGAVVPVSS